MGYLTRLQYHSTIDTNPGRDTCPGQRRAGGFPARPDQGRRVPRHFPWDLRSTKAISSPALARNRGQRPARPTNVGAAQAQPVDGAGIQVWATDDSVVSGSRGRLRAAAAGPAGHPRKAEGAEQRKANGLGRWCRGKPTLLVCRRVPAFGGNRDSAYEDKFGAVFILVTAAADAKTSAAGFTGPGDVRSIYPTGLAWLVHFGPCGGGATSARVPWAPHSTSPHLSPRGYELQGLTPWPFSRRSVLRRRLAARDEVRLFWPPAVRVHGCANTVGCG